MVVVVEEMELAVVMEMTERAKLKSTDSKCPIPKSKNDRLGVIPALIKTSLNSLM